MYFYKVEMASELLPFFHTWLERQGKATVARLFSAVDGSALRAGTWPTQDTDCQWFAIFTKQFEDMVVTVTRIPAGLGNNRPVVTRYKKGEIVSRTPEQNLIVDFEGNLRQITKDVQRFAVNDVETRFRWDDNQFGLEVAYNSLTEVFSIFVGDLMLGQETRCFDKTLEVISDLYEQKPLRDLTGCSVKRETTGNTITQFSYRTCGGDSKTLTVVIDSEDKVIASTIKCRCRAFASTLGWTPVRN